MKYHREAVADINVSRKWLPAGYRFEAWNGGLQRGTLLFYAVGRDWGQGCYVANSGLVLFISALCFVPSFPVKGYAGILCCVLIACLLNMVLRGFMNLLQSRRETRLLWEIGTADTKINWKGKGYLCGHHMKVRVQGSEKGTEIPAGAPVMVVGMEGFKPVVAQV